MTCRLKTLLIKIGGIHDVEYKQRYGDILPYSQHLEWVKEKALKYKELLKPFINKERPYSSEVIVLTAYAHDLLEDTTMTYNDIEELIGKIPWYMHQKDIVLEAIYNLTDEKGRNRSERKNDKYYKELSANPLAIYIKLCDILVNTLFSKLNGSNMYEKYKKEFPHFKERTYKKQFDVLYQEIEKL